MALHIRQINRGWPTNGFPFTEPKTGKLFDGMSADLRLQAQNVIQHRKANPNIFPPNDLGLFDQHNVERQIINQICAARPEACYDDSLPEIMTQPQQSIAPASKKCFKCGSSDLEPIYCKTCSGKRILAYRCKACNQEVPK